MMSEILNCIKLIKMYAWEKPFAKAVIGMCIFVLNTFVSLIIKNTIFICIIISKEAITTAVKNIESFFVEKKTFALSHGWVVFHTNPCKFWNFQTVVIFPLPQHLAWVVCDVLLKHSFSQLFPVLFAAIRRAERKALVKGSFLQGLNMAVALIIPTMATVGTFCVHVAAGKDLSTSQVCIKQFYLDFLAVIWHIFHS